MTGSVEDGRFVATCAEFPLLPWLVDPQAAVLQVWSDVVAYTVADLVSVGEATASVGAPSSSLRLSLSQSQRRQPLAALAGDVRCRRKSRVLLARTGHRESERPAPADIMGLLR